MIDQWLEWARGPLFRAALVIMVLGLIRLLILNIVNIITVLYRTGNRNIPVKAVIRETMEWIFPIKRALSNSPVFSITSLLFHLSIILVPLLLGAHILLWKQGLGIHWPAITNRAADYLTILAIITAFALFFQRVGARDSRQMSRFQDYALPLVIAVPFISGFLAMHPLMNPFTYQATMLVHVLSSNLVLILIPFTKLGHMVFFFFAFRGMVPTG